MNILKALLDSHKTKMVFVVRTDLNMKSGKIASQCAHAAVALVVNATNNADSFLNSWLSTGQPKVVLRVDKDCDNELRELFKIASDKKLNACLVRDAGRTQVRPGTLTVLGIGPNKSEEIDQLTRKYKLL